MWPDCSSSGMDGLKQCCWIGQFGRSRGGATVAWKLVAWVEQDSQCALPEITLPMLWSR